MPACMRPSHVLLRRSPATAPCQPVLSSIAPSVPARRAALATSVHLMRSLHEPIGEDAAQVHSAVQVVVHRPALTHEPQEILAQTSPVPQPASEVHGRLPQTPAVTTHNGSPPSKAL